MGKASILGEVNSHAYNMACYLTGLEAEQVSAHLANFAERREVYDNVYATLRFPDGARAGSGAATSPPATTRASHSLSIGETGQLRWNEEDPEYLS